MLDEESKRNVSSFLVTVAIVLLLVFSGPSSAKSTAASVYPSGRSFGYGNGDKVAVCHIPPGNTGNPQTIWVSESAVPAHLAHSDTLGSCPT
jgi:hypothetical protein